MTTNNQGVSKSKKQDISKSDIYVQEITLGEYPDIYDNSNTDQLFGITIDGEILKTPKGNPIVHENDSLLLQLVAELDYSNELDVEQISLYNLLSTQIDFISHSSPEFGKDQFDRWLLNDPVLRTCNPPEMVEVLKFLQIIFDYLKKHEIDFPHLPQFPISMSSNEWFLNEEQLEAKANFDKLINHVFNLYNEFDEYQKTVFVTVVSAFQSPLLAILLPTKQITPHEFAIILMNAFCINSRVHTDVTDREDEQKMLKTVTQDAECMLRYLQLFRKKANETEALIEQGESAKVEFKSTLRWNLKTNKSDSEIENSVLKTIVAFLNSQGGTLFIGVSDDGKAIGIEADNFPNEDKYLLHFANLVNSRIGKEFSTFIKWDLVTYKNKKIMEVECKPSDNPVFLKSKQEELFFVRTGPSSVKLSMSEFVNYSKNRFA